MSQFDGPVMTPRRPPPGVRQTTASAWCGEVGHPREVLRASTEEQLQQLETRWRCPRCGRPDPSR